MVICYFLTKLIPLLQGYKVELDYNILKISNVKKLRCTAVNSLLNETEVWSDFDPVTGKILNGYCCNC